MSEPADVTYGPDDDPRDRAIEAVEWNLTYLAECDAYMAETGCTESDAIVWRAELLLRGESP